MPFSLTDPGYYNKMADGILAVITFNNYKEVAYETKGAVSKNCWL